MPANIPIPSTHLKNVHTAIATQETALVVEFNPTHESQNLLAYGKYIPNTNQVATCSTVFIVEKNGEAYLPKMSLEMDARPSCLAWSSSILAIGCANGTVVVWDGETVLKSVIAYSGCINRVAWSDEGDNGKRILAAACEENSFVLFHLGQKLVREQRGLALDVEKVELESLNMFYRGVLKTSCKSVAFHRDTASLLMVGERSGAVRLMDWRSKTWVWHFWEPSFSDGFRPDGLGEADWSIDPLRYFHVRARTNFVALERELEVDIIPLDCTPCKVRFHQEQPRRFHHKFTLHRETLMLKDVNRSDGVDMTGKCLQLPLQPQVRTVQPMMLLSTMPQSRFTMSTAKVRFIKGD